MVVLDTSFLIDLIRKDSIALDKLIELEENGEMLCTTIINILELYKGVYRSSNIQHNTLELHAIIDGLCILDITPGVYEIFGSLSSNFLQKGCRIGDFDELIASISLDHNQGIITRDAHFDTVSGLRVIHY